METEQSVLEAASSFGLNDLEPHIRGNIPQAAEIVKNPPGSRDREKSPKQQRS